MNIAHSLTTFDIDNLKIGDLVAGEVIETLRNSQTPVLDWSSLFQAGGVVCDRIITDGGTTQLRSAYSTFRRVDNSTWRYCGNCLKGESAERGEVPIYEKLAHIPENTEGGALL